MVRRLIFCTIATTLILFVLGSCSQDKKNPEESKAISVEELDNTPDEAMLVRLNKIESDSIYATTLQGYRDKTFCLTGLSQIKGSLTLGDTLSIYPENNTKKVKICINVSELEGQWFYDMQQHRGMSFHKDGGMASINTEDFAFKSWELKNGKLYILYVGMQQVAEERNDNHAEEAEISYLDKENLELSFKNQKYSCKRQHQAIKFGE